MATTIDYVELVDTVRELLSNDNSPLRDLGMDVIDSPVVANGVIGMVTRLPLMVMAMNMNLKESIATLQAITLLGFGLGYQISQKQMIDGVLEGLEKES